MNHMIVDETPKRALDNVLLCETHSNHIRWRAGERLHHLFEQICDQLAEDGDLDHPAVDSAALSLTYAELDQASNRLARRLLAQGYGPGDVLALMFDRSAQSYIALLAVSKINAAYVPLDPAFPLDRVEFIGQDAGVSAILTLEAFADALSDATLPVLALDASAEQAAMEALSGDRLSPEETPEPVSELSYIIYTSGSTGRPKGVPIEQASICNFLRVAAETYGYDKHDRVYQGLTLAFDFSVEEILVPMMVGATLVPNQSGGSLVGADLGAFLAEKRVTAMCCVPTLLATIETDLPDLRLLIVSGEACPQEVMARWCAGGRRMLNAYGPTETTVTCTVQELAPGEPVTIGGPLPSYSAVVLAPGEARLLPFGETGELCIGGVGLSPGYLNRDDKTKAAFVEDFIGLPENPSGKIYRTGDLVRINASGRIEYLGRIDTQVKIRGYRIELSEIESVIMQSPFVAQAVVNPYEPEPGVKELVAYYTLADGMEGKDPDEVLRAIARQAKETLPPFMQPAFYEPLDAIPLLPSDKADRKALPKPVRPRLTLGGDGPHTVAEGDLETAIEAELAGLLGLERISVTADFFDDLGANSLQMARLSARLRDRLEGVEASMRDMYAHRSIRKLASLLDERAGSSAPMAAAPALHRASDWAYYGFGVAQISLGLAFGYLGAVIFFEVMYWLVASASWWDLYGRVILVAVGFGALALALPLATKWLLWGSFREESFPVWSSRHFRFWVVKAAIQVNPFVAFAGSPIFIAYLKALGAKVGWDAAIYTNRLPVATDLITIGDGAILRPNTILNGYKVEGGMIRIGRVTVGDDCFVGEGSVLDIDTEMGTGAELAHTSCLHEGGYLQAGGVYHGSPAEEADPSLGRYNTMPRARVSRERKIWYSAFLIGIPLVLAPLGMMLLFWMYSVTDDVGLFKQPSDLFTLSVVDDAWGIAAFITGFYFLAMILGLVFIAVWPRFWWMFLTKNKTYKLYGLNYFIYGFVKSGSNSRAFNTIFGDSSFIVGYLKWIGYRFTGGYEQTGSNFGIEQRHDVPFLCDVRRGTMVSDGLQMVNADYSAGRFKLSEATLGYDSFFGNNIIYPAASVTETNCLYGTKVMVPTTGPAREDTGLLGSPAFEIPRSIKRDEELTGGLSEEEKAARLRAKNRHNLFTIAAFIGSGLSIALASTFIVVLVLGDFGMLSPLGFITAGLISWVTITALLILYERLTLRFGRLAAQECSVLDPYFWYHERHWKMSIASWANAYNETPLKGFIWRRLGVKVGRRLYDEGAAISEKTLTEIGDDCCFNVRTSLQGHSLEDGAFKSGPITVGDGVTVGVGGFVHYGTEVGDGVLIDADCFYMKGSSAAAGSHWRGNPAEALRAPQAEARPMAEANQPLQSTPGPAPARRKANRSSAA